MATTIITMKRNKTVCFSSFLTLLLLFQACSAEPESKEILPGAYRTKQYLPLLKGNNVALVVNKGSLIDDINLVDTLLNLSETDSFNIIRIFPPEHGFGGTAEAGEHVANTTYSEKEIPIISLYGSKRKPSPNDLAGIDMVIFDLQDVGVRFFTYISTLHYVMEACAENNVQLLVLDRPNPNGFYIDGPVLEPEYKSFVGMHPVPIVYGMTIGEYAQMLNGEYWLTDSLQCKLEIIPCANYTHNSFYELPVPPSPNLPDMKSVYLYPSTCLFEGTIISEGRGTDAPFQIIGHPDFSDRDFSFVPESRKGFSLNPKFKGEVCYGLDLRNIPIDSLRDKRLIDLSYLKLFYSDLKSEKFFLPFFNLLAGNNSLRNNIEEEVSEEAIRAGWKDNLSEFKKTRAKYLLYPDFE